jgi:rubrerythrin
MATSSRIQISTLNNFRLVRFFTQSREGKMGYVIDKENNDREYDIELDLQILREDLAAELLAVNQYQEHIESLTDKEAIKILQDIRDTKQVHIVKLFKLIQRFGIAQVKNQERRHDKDGS